MTLDTVNLSDPAVRALLGTPSALAERPPRDFVQITGDEPRGMSATQHLDSQKHEVVCVYRGRAGEVVLTVDVYAIPGEPITLHLFCPQCHKHSRVTGDRKAIDFDARAENPMRGTILEYASHRGLPELRDAADHGRLSVGAFECTWEIGGERHVPGAVHTGASLCRMRLVIDDNRVRDA